MIVRAAPAFPAGPGLGPEPGPELGSRLGPWIGAAAVAGALLLTFAGTTASILDMWSRSETFTHGYLVLPIFLWLVWRERAVLAHLEAVPDRRLLLPLLAAGLLWTVSTVADLQAGRQLALVLMLILVIASFLGPAVSRALGFPLLFLLFLAPIGEELVPVLMRVTADLTAGAISMTGIPIYREGLFFSLPSGDWSVVEACSGVRYLIASMMLGALYAHLSYRDPRRQLLFFALSAVVPIIANGVRAFLIVMIGHFSSMRLATGADHLVYGWLFFGIVMFALFSLGSLFREKASEPPAAVLPAPGNDDDPATSTPRAASSRRLIVHALLVAACVSIWPSWASLVAARQADMLALADVDAPVGHDMVAGGGSESTVLPGNSPTRWRPSVEGQDRTGTRIFEAGPEHPAVLALAYVYAVQRQGKEMVSSANALVDPGDDTWRRTGSGMLPPTAARPTGVEQSLLVSRDQSLLVRRWYAVGARSTASGAIAKLLETRDKLLLSRSRSVMHVIAADAADPVAAAAALDAAMRRMAGAVRTLR